MDVAAIENPLSFAALGAVALYIITHLARKAWQNVTEAALDTQKELAESSVVSLMRNELARLSQDIASMKADHARDIANLKSEFERERSDLVVRIRELERRVEQMNKRFSSIRIIAMDIYHMVSTLEAPEDQKEVMKQHLSRIISEGNLDE